MIVRVKCPLCGFTQPERNRCVECAAYLYTREDLKFLAALRLTTKEFMVGADDTASTG